MIDKENFDIDLRYKNTRSPDGRQNVVATIDGLEYDGLVHQRGQKLHLYIPVIDKTLVFLESNEENFGCLYPNKCLMPSFHFTNECHTDDDI